LNGYERLDEIRCATCLLADLPTTHASSPGLSRSRTCCFVLAPPLILRDCPPGSGSISYDQRAHQSTAMLPKAVVAAIRDASSKRLPKAVVAAKRDASSKRAAVVAPVDETVLVFVSVSDSRLTQTFRVVLVNDQRGHPSSTCYARAALRQTLTHLVAPLPPLIMSVSQSR
jgi:hypothetical protein